MARSFLNEKKTFLAKLDRSKKGGIDKRIVPLLAAINKREEYYTTSSCSGRVYLWQGSGKKNETEWLRVSHNPITPVFFDIPKTTGLVWLRLEPLILHIACKDLAAANRLLERSRIVCKKSCLLSFSQKIVMEIRGSEFLEIPLFQDGRRLFPDTVLLLHVVDEKLARVFSTIAKLKKEISKL